MFARELLQQSQRILEASSQAERPRMDYSKPQCPLLLSNRLQLCRRLQELDGPPGFSSIEELVATGHHGLCYWLRGLPIGSGSDQLFDRSCPGQGIIHE